MLPIGWCHLSFRPTVCQCPAGIPRWLAQLHSFRLRCFRLAGVICLFVRLYANVLLGFLAGLLNCIPSGCDASDWLVSSVFSSDCMPMSCWDSSLACSTAFLPAAMLPIGWCHLSFRPTVCQCPAGIP